MIIIGWRERVSLPLLGICNLRAKVDSGARTSALHVCSCEEFVRDGAGWVRFGVPLGGRKRGRHPLCEAPLVERRSIRSSSGQSEQRYVIRTTIALGDLLLDREITLTDRSLMQFRMLLGRTTFRGVALVDARRSYLLGDEGPATFKGE